MYFKRIEMHGFKSFAEPVTIDFNEGITCIVGPNGSGKSNISDAIRWVLGEQSPKTLRGGKMEDIIFAGTASRKSRGMAEVTLVIDNKCGILPIDFSEVAITRRMYRSGESEYSINNSHCRLRDIRELIMDTGIGVDGYSLIGQGKIADIVSNKSESRREIFEEAAGIVKYRSKKSEAERKLEATNVNLERVNDIVSEIEGR
ncbi:MAG: AAA family ATPase, partial [Peptostreptococcaceae bacterium]|nr:AAA family ATPase [Peptostreptococcaceae bacterium]